MAALADRGRRARRAGGRAVRLSVPVLLNAQGGTAAARGSRIAEEATAAFAAAGLAADVRLLEGGQMAEAVAAVADAPLVVVGGGDGTLGSAAGALLTAGSGAALGILALGTRNHLAAELGVPADLGAAARLIAGGKRRRIDVGRVNGRYFVNNASIGLYPALVERRDALKAAGLPKWLANLPAAGSALARLRHHRLRLTLDGERRPIRTPLLFVGNNRYLLDRRRLGQRARLDEEVLSLFAVGPRSRAGLIGLALRTAVGRADRENDYAALAAVPSFTVRLHGDDIAVALDGEVTRLSGPLRFECMAGALEVAVPAA